MKGSIGIDPGKQGGIVVLSQDSIKTHAIPKIKNEVDIREIANILKQYDTTEYFVGIESVHAIFGASAKSTFEFGKICGILEGIVSTLGFKYILVQPKQWQKEMFTGIPEIRKPHTVNKKGKIIKGRIETKKMAELAYKRLFPEVDLYITDIGSTSKNVHDGLVDAILISEFCRRKYL